MPPRTDTQSYTWILDLDGDVPTIWTTRICLTNAVDICNAIHHRNDNSPSISGFKLHVSGWYHQQGQIAKICWPRRWQIADHLKYDLSGNFNVFIYESGVLTFILRRCRQYRVLLDSVMTWGDTLTLNANNRIYVNITVHHVQYARCFWSWSVLFCLFSGTYVLFNIITNDIFWAMYLEYYSSRRSNYITVKMLLFLD